MMNYRFLTISVIVIAILLTLVVLLKIPDEQVNLLNLISVIGTIASLLGLILAYIQILSIKDTAIRTREAVEESITRVNEILSISELSKGIKNIGLAQNSIKNRKYDHAEILMKELKGLLIQAKHVRELSNKTSTTEFQGLLMNLGIDLNNLRQLESNDGIEIDHFKILSNLDEVSSVLIDLENKLKFKNYERRAD